jgi:YVTN family beta-propeller protein
MLDPIAPSHVVGNFPLAAALSPERDRIALLLCGWRQQGVQIVDRASGEVLQTLEQKAAFVGLAFSSDGTQLFASGGNEDSVFVYRWQDRRATLETTIALTPKSYPAGLAATSQTLYVAGNLGDSIEVVDLATRKVVQHVGTDRYPYAVVVDGRQLFVSCWGDDVIDRFPINADGTLGKRSRIVVARHPSAMLLHAHKLFIASATTDTIAVLDTQTRKVKTLTDPPPAGPHEGSTPNAFAVSGNRLFVAEADSNAVAVFDLCRTGDPACPDGRDRLSFMPIGRVPVEWYPTALLADRGEVIVINGKGRGSRPNPKLSPTKRPPDSCDYSLGQLDGTVLTFRADMPLRDATKRVTKANGWDVARKSRVYPFKHVIYVIKENRTYDQIFGDVAAGDGDPSLLFFDAASTPNHRALAARFGLFDRFFVNAEVSATGHNWSTAAYSSDYVQKVVPAGYSGRGRTYDHEGLNRGAIVDDDDDVASPSTGYLWDLAARKKLWFRDYGEFVVRASDVGGKGDAILATKRALVAAANPDYPPFDLDTPDQRRADIWLAELDRDVAAGKMPAFEIVRLPNDHTSGGKEGKPTPRVYMADNDLALGRMVEAVSKSPFWRDTVFFVVEDDAQSGPDHVDSHRSVLLVISAYNRPGTVHRFVNTTGVIATMEEILGLDSLSQFDHFGRPLHEIFTDTPDLTPYEARRPPVDMNEKNPPSKEAEESKALDFSKPDAIEDATLNRILWRAIKGDVPYPGATRSPTALHQP